MKLVDHYDGSNRPFEGELPLVLCSLPVGARIEHARFRLEPVEVGGGEAPFSETLHFRDGQGDWGATLSHTNDSVEVDFHARRTLVKVEGSKLKGAALQIDLGGALVEINERGTIRSPGEALFSLPAGGELPPLTVNRFRLLAAGAGLSAVTIRSTPSNLQLRLPDVGTVWSLTGELTAAQSSPDLGALLQQLLPRLEQADGYSRLPFILHSDTLGRLRVTVEIDYLMEAGLLPAGLPEVTFPFRHATLPEVENTLLQATLPPEAVVLPGKSRVRLTGAFEESRIAVGPLGSVEHTAQLPLTPSLSRAQPLTLERPVALSALDLLLAATTEEARLRLDLRGDLDGKPDATSLLQEPVAYSLKRKQSDRPTWISVPLPRELLMEGGGQRCWLVLQSEEGEVLWSVTPATDGLPGMQHSNDGGFSWRRSTAGEAAGSVTGWLRLRQRPAHYQVPLLLQVGKESAARRIGLDRFQPLGRVDFTLDSPDLAEAFNDYLQNTVPASACLETENIADGGFDRWLCDGGRLVGPAEMQMEIPPRLLVTAPREERLYVALETQHGTTRLETIAASGERAVLAEQISGEPVAMAVALDGRLYLVTKTKNSSSLYTVLDGETGHVLDGPVDMANGIVDMKVSPDGALLYLVHKPYDGTSGEIRIFDSTMLTPPLATLSFRRETETPRAVAFGPSPAGPLLYVLTSTSEDGRLYRYETRRHTLFGEPLRFDAEATDLAITPCGVTAAVRLRDVLQLIDMERWRPGPEIPLDPQVPPTFLRLSPDGRWGYVIGEKKPPVLPFGDRPPATDRDPGATHRCLFRHRGRPHTRRLPTLSGGRRRLVASL